jgi:signal transduction histidine kinase/CheY-like chemotaxis protein
MLEAPFRRSMVELGLAAGLLALTGLLIALRLSRRVARSVASLSRAAEALGCGEAPLPPDVGIREIEQAGAALLNAAQLLMRRSAERDFAIESLQRANEGLEECVSERMSDLAAANRRLSQETQHRRQAEEALAQQRKIEAIGQLTAGIAHDFNNLLTAVIGNLEMLRPGLSDERTQKLVADALSAAGRGARLTRRLLAFGRNQELETRIIDVNELIAGAGPLLDQAVGPFVELELRLVEQGAAVAVDAAQMELALLNLAINARDAMPDGGRLVIETQRLSASVGDPNVAAGEWAVIAVTDTGVGMSAEVVERAFDPFFTTKGAGAGSGLGLSMVHGLVKQLGGDVVIASEVGKGTSVKIYLRRTAEAPARPAKALRAPANAPSKASVLVVDDDPAVLGFMADVLSDAGHQVGEASSGAAALDLFAGGDGFDAVVLDYAMPGMDGIATARVLRARRRDIRILLVTGFAVGMPPGEWPAADILDKPFGAESLRQWVASLISRPRDSQGVLIDPPRRTGLRADALHASDDWPACLAVPTSDGLRSR